MSWQLVVDTLYLSAPLLVALVVLALFLDQTRKLIPRANALEKELREATAILSDFEDETASTRFIEIDEQLKNRPLLGHHWKEFAHSCVRSLSEDGSVRVESTIDAAHFFSREDVIEANLLTDFARHAPGMFTALGIVGTFLGIWLGLGKAGEQLTQVSGSEKNAASLVTQATTSLLEHVGPAFGVSFTAVLLAVIFLILERTYAQRAATALLRFQKELDRIFVCKTSEGLLQLLTEESKTQSLSLQKLSSDFALRMEPVLQRIVEQQARHMDEANQALVANIAAAIHEKLDPLSRSLSSTAAELKADQSKSATGAIESLVHQFSNSLTSGAQNQMSELSTTVQSLAQVLNLQRSEMEKYLGRVGETSQQQAQLLESQVAKLIEQTQQQQTGTLERLERLFTDQGKMLTERTSEASRHSLEALTSAGQGLSSMVQQSIDAQNGATATLNSTVSQLQATMTEQITTLVKHVSDATRTTTATADKTRTETSERIANIMAVTQKSIEGSLQRLSDSLVAQSAKQEAQASAQLTSTLTGLKLATEDLVKQLRTETISQLSDVSRVSSEASQKSVEAVSAAGQTLSSLITESIQAQNTATTALHDKIGQLQAEMTHQVSTLVAQATQATQASSNSAMATQKTTSEHIVQLVTSTKGSVEDSLTKLADSLNAQSLAQQTRANELLTRTLDSLRVATEQLVLQLRTATQTQITDVSRTVTEFTAKASEQVQASASGGLNQIAQAVQSTLERLTSQMNSLTVTSNRVNSALVERFDTQATLLERLTKQTNEGISEVTTDLTSAAAVIADLVKQTRQLVQDINTHVNANRESTGKLLNSSQLLDSAATNIKAQSTVALTASNSLTALIQKLEAQNGATDERIKLLRTLHQEMTQLAASLSNGVGLQTQTIAEMNAGFQRLKENANNYFSAVIPKLSEALGQFDKELTRGTQMLGGAVERMAEPCEAMADTLEQLRRQLRR